MARAGVASRRDAEAMIAEGRVTLNGTTLTTPAIVIGPEDAVTVDGVPLPPKEKTRLWLYHKPAGLVTTAHDPEGRPTVFEAMPPDLPRVVSIGRLDINTEGLLLVTNDGGLAQVLAHPETGWLRRYRVRAYGEITQEILDTLADGVTIDEMHYGPIEARIDRAQGDNVWLMLGLREGKNREVKRVLEHLGMRVNRLIRVSFGPFQLGELEEGAVEEVRTRVLRDQLGQELARQAGVDFDLPTREETRAAEQGYERAPRGRAEERGKRAFPRDERTPREAERERRPAGKDGKPARAVWRDPETDATLPKGVRKPRRGADPQAARSESGERERQRAGRVADPKGRSVVVERIVTKPKPVDEPPRGERERKPRSGPSRNGPPRSGPPRGGAPRSGPPRGRRGD